MLYNITRLNRDIRDARDIRNARDARERLPSRKTPIDSYSKLKARIIKNQI